MVRGLLGALLRLSAVWVPAWTLICCGCIPAMDEHNPQWTGVRFVLWTAAIVSTVWEIRRMTRQLIARSDALREAEMPLPHRLDITLTRPLTHLLLGLIVSVVLCTRWIITPGFVNPLEWLAVMLLAINLLTLVGGAWSGLLYRWATRKLTPAPYPRSAPLLVAGAMTMVMVLLLIRSPRTALVQLSGRAAMSGLMAMAGDDPFEPVEMLVEIGPDDHIGEVESILRRYGARATPAVPSALPSPSNALARTYRVTARGSVAAMLAFELAFDAENVEDVTVNELVPAMATEWGRTCMPSGPALTNDPLSSAQAPLAQIGAARLFAYPNYGAAYRPAVSIHVLDDGIQSLHEDLSGVVAQPSSSIGKHGTAVAGIVAARTHNRTGIASLNGVLAPFSITDHDVLNGTPAVDDIAEALAAAAWADADVAVLAMSAPGRAPKLVREAAQLAQRQGVVLVAAAGNHGGSARNSWPANLPGVLVATAGDSRGRSSFSASADGLIGVSAPGIDICAPTTEGGYHSVTGTSMSAALVASAVGLYAARCPQSTASQRVEAVLRVARPPLYGVGEPTIDVGMLAISACP